MHLSERLRYSFSWFKFNQYVWQHTDKSSHKLFLIYSNDIALESEQNTLSGIFWHMVPYTEIGGYDILVSTI